ncbi:MAG TPA: zinc-binding dehydrogenase [Thermoanaerobaculia bacterium]|nr:zinc-binding dehydrogenase [Thermoanaerobaculia bacterium]
MTMRAIVATRLGEPEVLELSAAPRPEPGPGQVLVRVHRVGVNFSDTERRRAVYRQPNLPWIPGGEGAGVVEAVGEGVDAALRGRRVGFFKPPTESGAYAEYAVAPASTLFFLSDRLSFDEGAALPLQGLTAYGLVRIAARIEAGQTVLIHAAGGGLGLLAVQLCRLAGARVLGTASTEAKAEAVRAMGGEPLAYGDDLVERVFAATARRGVDVVLDSVGQATQDASLAMLAPYGHLVFYGDASGPPRPIDPDRLYQLSLKVSAFTLEQSRHPELWETARRDLLRWVEDGSLRLTIARVLPLAAAAEAHRLIESRQVAGKLLLDVNGE